jgi:hypothetical protein
MKHDLDGELLQQEREALIMSTMMYSIVLMSGCFPALEE